MQTLRKEGPRLFNSAVMRGLGWVQFTSPLGCHSDSFSGDWTDGPSLFWKSMEAAKYKASRRGESRESRKQNLPM